MYAATCCLRFNDLLVTCVLVCPTPLATLVTTPLSIAEQGSNRIRCASPLCVAASVHLTLIARQLSLMTLVALFSLTSVKWNWTRLLNATISEGGGGRLLVSHIIARSVSWALMSTIMGRIQKSCLSPVGASCWASHGTSRTLAIVIYRGREGN